MTTTNSRKIKVLVVDDNYHINVDVLSYHLRSLGRYDPQSAFTVEEFKARVAEADIVILDIRLPDRENGPIDPWGGLKALFEMQTGPNLHNAERMRLARTIIRSGQTKDDALRLGENIPVHYRWLKVDAPLSKLTRALTELSATI